MRTPTRTAVTPTAGSAVAPPRPTARPADSVVPVAVVNLGPTTDEARKLQSYLRTFYFHDSTGSIDGQSGTNSWKAMQRSLGNFGYTGAIDGVVGGGTISALQRLLRSYGCDGRIDGIAGPATRAAFKMYATTRWDGDIPSGPG
ncbi:hypothetical protein GCM10027160_36560 [Streptomyces calidiresistens]|nr:peptidoglycan-binding domain-containing protein [Streptomyces calidiresistens]